MTASFSQLESNSESSACVLSADWTAEQLARLRQRADGLESEDAHSAQIATAGLLASM